MIHEVKECYPIAFTLSKAKPLLLLFSTTIILFVL
jgi:hypothetical protein